MTAHAQAHPNIALIKYWGKRDDRLNLPATGSLSITLESMSARTRVAFDRGLDDDVFRLDGEANPAALARVVACLDLLRARAGTTWRARVDSSNDFPAGAGLASSASGFAALVLAASTALDLRLDRRELSVLARRASGSAARSMFGGFVAMSAGSRADGDDACAEPLLDAGEWPLEVVIAVTSHGAKAIGSSTGMDISRRSSPFHGEWIAGSAADLDEARRAVLGRDFAALAAVSEHNGLKMHAVMLASRPALVYWSGATLDCLHCIRALREREGLEVFFTSDAGAQAIAVCRPAAAARVAASLSQIPGVHRLLRSALGEGAHLVADIEAA
ncbi:MAG TPA: diphosphomevalonate decarboxylase [Caldimonas sp.]|nr:diphosphomevalonate decarboxylase [Caldimonas sp.]